MRSEYTHFKKGDILIGRCSSRLCALFPKEAHFIIDYQERPHGNHLGMRRGRTEHQPVCDDPADEVLEHFNGE